MAYSNISVKFDNGVQAGDTSLTEALSLIGQTIGMSAGIAEPVRDSEGKLISVTLRFPDTVSDAALVAIASNSGVAATVVCPDRRFILALSDATPDGLTFSGTALQASLQFISVYNTNELGRFTSAGYTDFAEETNPDTRNRIQIDNFSKTTDIVINSGELVLNATASDSVTVLLQAPLTVKKYSGVLTGRGNSLSCYYDVDGNIYTRQSLTNDLQKGPFTYEDACLNGAL